MGTPRSRPQRGGIIAPMSDPTDNLEPPARFKPDQTQPLKAIKKRRRWRSILLGVSGVLVLLALGGVGGYTMEFRSGRGAVCDHLAAAHGTVPVHAG